MKRRQVRNKDKRNSDLSCFVDDYCGHEMYAGDIDLYIAIVRKKLLRLYESKKPSEGLTPGQQWLYRTLRYLIVLGIKSGILEDGSGVYIVRGKYPYEEGAEITRYGDAPVQLSQPELIRFLEGGGIQGGGTE